MLEKILSRKVWSLHNPLKMWTLHRMTHHELQLVVQTLSSAETSLSLVWKNGWSDWRKIKDFEDLFVSAEEDAQAPPLPKLDGSEEEITQVKLIQSRAPRDDSRRHNRYVISVDVEIVRGEQTLKVKTADVSESGIRFTEDLPEWVAGYFTLIFNLGSGAFEITGALVEDQKQIKNRAEIVDTNDEESGLPKYLSWVRSLGEQGYKKIGD